MDGINIIHLLAKLGELSGRLQAAVDMEQWVDAVRTSTAIEMTLLQFHNAIVEKVAYCVEKSKDADVQETAVGRRDVE